MATPFVFFLTFSEKKQQVSQCIFESSHPSCSSSPSTQRCKNQSFTTESKTLLSWTSLANGDLLNPPGDSSPAGKCGAPLRPPGCACWWASGSPPTVPCGFGAHPGKKGRDVKRPSWTLLNRSVTTVMNLTPRPGSSCHASSSTAPSGGPSCCPAWRQKPGHRWRPAADVPVSPPLDLHARVWPSVVVRSIQCWIASIPMWWALDCINTSVMRSLIFMGMLKLYIHIQITVCKTVCKTTTKLQSYHHISYIFQNIFRGNHKFQPNEL